MWTLVSYGVGVHCERCDFCFHLSEVHFSAAFEPLLWREYPRNVWFTFKILLRKFQRSFTIHPDSCAAQFLQIIMMIVQERICVFICELLNSNFVKFLNHARKCCVHIYLFF